MMSFLYSRSCIQAAALAAILACHLGLAARAQVKSSLVWEKPVVVKRVKKAYTKPPRPLPQQERVSLLTLQWNLLMRGDGNVKEAADPRTVFRTGDQLKLVITANQNGYLYIVTQPQGQDGAVIFPDPRVNGGSNFVKKDQEYVVPAYCPGFPDPYDCWWEMAPPAGTENLIVIFSRDQITSLPAEVTKPNEAVRQGVVDDLMAKSRQMVKQETGQFSIAGRGAVRYATRVQNINKNDNEELIATISLKHAE